VVNNPGDLQLSIKGTNDSLTIAGYYNMQPANFVFQFADGTLGASDMASLPALLEGTEDADTLYTPSSMAGILNGNGGDDVLNGSNGNDILQGNLGDDTLNDNAGNNLLDGGQGTDSLTGGAGNEFFAGGAGNDTITTGDGADVMAFNRGDGQDTINGGIGTDNTLSLGGGIQYADLSLSRTGNDLILEVGSGEQVTLANWYDTSANYKSLLNLQIVADAMATYDPASADPLLNQTIQNFDFTAIVDSFDQSGVASQWSLMNSLLAAHLSGSDAAALGGDLAHQYGMTGNFSGMNLAAAQGVINDPQFGNAMQSLQPLQGLKGGSPTLA
jgi:Ca2+-binding RTX toxin-like protein